MEDVQPNVYLDYVNKRLYYYRKTNTSKNICFFDYDGVLWKNISFAEGNVDALTIFRDFLYLQKMDTTVIQKMNVSTGVVYRNISLPKPFSRFNYIAIVEQSQLPPIGKMKRQSRVTLISIKVQSVLFRNAEIVRINYYSGIWMSLNSRRFKQMTLAIRKFLLQTC